MKSTTHLLATVKPGRFLTPGNPTGLTGLYTHPAPRAKLLFLYRSTLSKLAQLPEHSVYRQSAEALTRNRLKIVQAQKPDGYEQWLDKVQKIIDSHPDKFGKGTRSEDLAIEPRSTSEEDDRDLNWNGQAVQQPALEGPRLEEERDAQDRMLQRITSSEVEKGGGITWEPEPPLSAIQVEEIETQIGGGLIEEVIQVAEGERNLVDTMLESRVWEELSEKPPHGQWEYFARDQHTPGTQEPPNKT